MDFLLDALLDGYFLFCASLFPFVLLSLLLFSVWRIKRKEAYFLRKLREYAKEEDLHET